MVTALAPETAEWPAGRMSVAEFRALQERRPDRERWELVAGTPRMMAPASLAHNRIASNLERLLNDALIRADPSWAAQQRPGFEIEAGDYRPEPDVAVIDADFAAGQRFVGRAYLLAEIISGTDRDRVGGLDEAWIEVKRRIYLGHEPCRAVLLVEQDRFEARLDLRQEAGAGWASHVLSGVGAVLALPAFGLRCPLRALYEGTPLAPRGA